MLSFWERTTQNSSKHDLVGAVGNQEDYITEATFANGGIVRSVASQWPVCILCWVVVLVCLCVCVCLCKLVHVCVFECIHMVVRGSQRGSHGQQWVWAVSQPTGAQRV